MIRNNTAGVKYTLSASGIQVGGDPALLKSLFEEYGGHIGNDGYMQIDSGDQAIQNTECTNLINAVVGYANTISSQLHSINDYHLYNPTTAPWSSIMIYPGAVDPDTDTLQAMRDLSVQYPADEDSLTF